MRFLLVLLLSIAAMACDSKKEKKRSDMTESHKYTNELINESSPYLLQHAHNPVNWVSWSDEAFDQAKREGKLVLVSVGYSACHWCHVMEHQSFENPGIAKIMNDYFVCIKVDREEYPDVDNTYMKAVQMMTGQGGWPLNCFTLADGRPIYGGTYFRPEQWTDILLKLSSLQREQPDKLEDYAKQLTEGIKSSADLIKVDILESFDSIVLKDMVDKWQSLFDDVEGGANRAPKFPMPNNYAFLQQYGTLNGKPEVISHVDLTLTKMYWGGIYDQVGGGFARYSVDAIWKVPHFEKMLYDNAQLVSLYSDAYKRTKSEEYLRCIEHTMSYLEREMKSDEGLWYSALDADSEGEEGKYYVWTEEELRANISEENWDIFKTVYNINPRGLWEHGNYILLRTKSWNSLSKELGIQENELIRVCEDISKRLLVIREKRVRPGLDNKQICSWNGMCVSAYVDAYSITNNTAYLESAANAMRVILDKMTNADGALYHIRTNGESKILGYLEDYAFVIEALIKLAQHDDSDDWLSLAKNYTDYTIEHFYNTEKSYFNFNPKDTPGVIYNAIEVEDNVIPASNSVMAKNLFLMGHLWYDDSYIDISKQLLSNVYDAMPSYGSAFSNWGQMALWYTHTFNVVVITGADANKVRSEFNTHYLPNAIVLASNKERNDGVFKDRWQNEVQIYVCEGHTCKRPVSSKREAIELLGE